jgi:hypothetical protein
MWLIKITDPNAILMRKVMCLQTFEFKINYRKGKKHSKVAALSRPVLMSAKRRRLKDTLFKQLFFLRVNSQVRS